MEDGECLDVKKQKGEWVSMKHSDGDWNSIKEKDGEWRELNGEEQCSVKDDRRYAELELDCIDGEMKLVKERMTDLVVSLGPLDVQAHDIQLALKKLEVQMRCAHEAQAM